MISSLDLSALRAHHDNDAPRLHVAQQLRAQGDPRGEFIETQCALARLSPQASPERNRLEAREAELLEDHAQDWLSLAGLLPGEGHFVRGFLESIELSWSRYREAHEQLCLREPVRDLRLTDIRASTLPSNIHEFSATPLASSLSSLRLDGQLDADTIEALGSIRLPQLKTLDLDNNLLGTRGAKRLANSPLLTGVTTLSLSRNDLGPDGLKLFLASPYLASLESLDLGSNGLDARAAAMLVASPIFSRMNHLDLGSNPLRKEGAKVLAKGGGRSKIKSLVLSHASLGGVGTQEILDSPLADGMTSIALAGNCEDGDICDFERSAYLSSVTSLDLSANCLSGRPFLSLSRAATFWRLTSLNLSSNGLVGNEMARFASGRPTALQFLDLSLNPIGATGAQQLARGAFDHLATLVLQRSHIDDEGAEALANARWMRGIARLDLAHNWICDAGANALVRSPYLTGRTALSLHNNCIPLRGEAALRERFGNDITH